jgi:cyclase
MLQPRVIPCLLLKDRGLVKTVRFLQPKYVGDPINAVKIFNDRFVDEIIFLDIAASEQHRPPSFGLVEQIAGECFIPLCYGGGIRTPEDARTLFGIGVEKISLNTEAAENPSLVNRLAEKFGSQSIVVSMDMKETSPGNHTVWTRRGTRDTHRHPSEYATEMEQRGAGELLVNSIDRDGTGQGYDLKLIRLVTEAIGIPVIACGGAGNLSHLAEAIHTGASAAAAGSLFVFHGKHRAVLISYPSHPELKKIFSAP